MKTFIAIMLIVSQLLLTGCTAPRADSATFDRFPLNWGRAEKGVGPIKVIALVPGGGTLTEAVGLELEKRGFVILSPTATMNMASEVDFKAVLENYIPARRNPGEMWKLRRVLQSKGVDAFLIVRERDFVARRHLGRDFWQMADLELHSTTEENATSNGAIAGTGYSNPHRDRASTASEAAVAMVRNLATGPGGI